MLRWLAILAVVLTVAQTPMPTAGQAPDQSGSKHKNPNQNINSHENPSQTAFTIAPKKIGDGDKKPKSDQHGSTYQDPTIIIANPAPMPEPWSLHNKIFWLANVVLAIVAIWTLCYIRKQVAEMRRQGTIMRGTLDAIRKQTEISRKALVAQFRPKIVVRSITLDPDSVAEFDERGNGQWEIKIFLANKGDTVAHIEVCRAEAYWESHYPAMKRAEIGNEDFGEFSMEAGGMHPLVIPIKQGDFRMSLSVVEHVKKRGETPYEWPVCIGYILYRDENGCQRETAFERKWDIKSGRFIPSEDPEAEYSD